MKKNTIYIMALIHFLFAFYLINFPFQFVKIPQAFSTAAGNWIIFLGGVLLLWDIYVLLKLNKMIKQYGVV